MPILKLYSDKHSKPRPELLIHPNIPKPMHLTTPRSILGKVWWQGQKKEAERKYNYHCAACGVHKTEAIIHQWLECHECYSINYKKHTMEFIGVVPLCHACHSFIHDGRLYRLYENKEINKRLFNRIMKHGERILKRNGLVRPIYTEDGSFWSEWRLLLYGKKYPGQFRCYSEWKNYNFSASQED